MGHHRSISPKDRSCYWLKNLRVPPGLVDDINATDDWRDVDILIRNSLIAEVRNSDAAHADGIEALDQKQSIVFSALVDPHVHLDKAHAAAFHRFEPGDLASAMKAMAENKRSWTPDSVTARAEFSIQTAYAYGVRAMRTHVDIAGFSPQFTPDILFEAQSRWAGRVELQISPLAGLDEYDDPVLAERIYSVAKRSGIIGIFIFDHPNLMSRLRPIFERANAEGWDIDFHVDEGTDPALNGLNAVSETTLATQFCGRILCGHCVALSYYDDERRRHTIERAIQAGIHFVSLPVTNLYLQGRGTGGIPTHRGMAPVRYLAQKGAVISLGADNVRDGFCTFGEFDPSAVLNLGAQIGHLPEVARDWAPLITTNPSLTMGLEWNGKIEPGAPADLVIFAARNSGEFGSGAGIQRTIIRNGAELDIAIPDYRELNPVDNNL